MRKLERILYLLFVLLLISNCSFAVSETDNIQSALKASTYEPNYFSILLSLVFVVFLIYITGILYTKLNKISVKTVKKELKESIDIKPVILSTTPIGHDKTLQVIEINGEKLLIGVSQHSINLIKTLGRVSFDDSNYVENKIEVKPVENNIKAEHTVNEDDFGLYKKYLR